MLEGFKYLIEDRKLDKDIIRKFHLSYCDSLGNIYTDTKFPSKNLKLESKFNNTVLFPILNVYGDLVGISARNLKKDLGKDDLKYVNTVYTKTNHLYGLDVTWPECIKQKTAYVVEGNVDTISMYQHGIKNVVGMLASAFSVKQACLLSRFVEEIIFVPDADKSGRNIINKRVKKLLREYKFDVNFSAVKLPEGYDPDDYLKKYGKEEFLKLEKVQLLDSNEVLF